MACKTDQIDAWVLAELSRRKLVPAACLPSFEMERPAGATAPDGLSVSVPNAHCDQVTRLRWRVRLTRMRKGQAGAAGRSLCQRNGRSWNAAAECWSSI